MQGAFVTLFIIFCFVMLGVAVKQHDDSEQNPYCIADAVVSVCFSDKDSYEDYIKGNTNLTYNSRISRNDSGGTITWITPQ